MSGYGLHFRAVFGGGGSQTGPPEGRLPSRASEVDDLAGVRFELDPGRSADQSVLQLKSMTAGGHLENAQLFGPKLTPLNPVDDDVEVTAPTKDGPGPIDADKSGAWHRGQGNRCGMPVTPWSTPPKTGNHTCL